MDEARAKYSQKDRDAMAKKGHALPDGSYPIGDAEDLDNAIHAVGRGGADHDKIRAHIIKSAKRLGLSSKIPDNWNSDGSLKGANAMTPLDARRQKAEQLKGREVRRFGLGSVEVREVGDDGYLHVAGVASVTARAYDMGFYQETIRAGAFARTLSQSPDVQLLINHEGLPLARTTNGSLDLREDDNGLSFEARMSPDDPDAVRVARKVQDGLMDQCSFAFRVVQQVWDEDYENREIVDLDLNRGDVSIVNQGANPFTSVTARSLFAELAEMSEDELFDMRDDPAVTTFLRRMTVTPVAGVGVDLDTYRARAWASRNARRA